MSIGKPPIVVDLDGTLTPTDTLVEAAVKLVKQSPLNLFGLLAQLFKGKVALKRHIASRVSLSPQTLPYREDFLDYLRRQKAEGRRLVLATASHKSTANAVAGYLDIFDEVIGTESTNFKGKQKLAEIRRQLGDEFVYAGDSVADIPIWQGASGAILVNASASTCATVHRSTSVEAEFSRSPVGMKTWAKAIRVHQWVKNLLIFVPMLTAFSFLDMAALGKSVLAFLAFSLAASATYVVNDLWDLDSDRAHPRKRFRPLASAEVPIVRAVLVSAGLLLSGFLLAGCLSSEFALMLLLYLVVTSSYSWVLKQYVLVDVILLALLYTLRIVAGSVAIGVTTSTWLLAFSVFLFLSLALVKRCSELVSLQRAGGTATSGRDYRVTDLTVLWPLGTGSAMAAVVVFGLFINSPETVERYASPGVLWAVALGLIYWLSRLWVKTERGEMNDDPVVYAIRDRASRMVVVWMAVVMVVARYVEIL